MKRNYINVDGDPDELVLCDDCGREADSGHTLVPREPIIEHLRETEEAVIEVLEESLDIEDVPRVFSDTDEEVGWRRRSLAPQSAAEVFIDHLQDLSEMEHFDDPVHLCEECYQWRYDWDG